MRIRISNPALVGDLLDFLRASNCLVMQTSRDILSVAFSDPLRYEIALLELELQLSDWRARHANVRAVVID